MVDTSTDTEYQPVQAKLSHQDLPRVDYDMRQHKLGIIINWTILFISSGVSPVVLYFALRYGAHLALSTTLGVASAVFGVTTVFSITKRTWALLRTNSECRPIGASKWAFDYFHINFMIGFVVITAVVVAGNVITDIRVFALGLPILVTAVCFEMFVVGLAASFSMRAPFRMSSVPKGDPIRSGVYILAEDIIAVDADQGKTFRRQLQDRYLASKTVQKLCREMDLLWGFSGTIVGAGSIVSLFVVPNKNVAFILGLAIPWGYAAIMAVFTLVYCKARLRNEEVDTSWLKRQVSPKT